MRKSLKLNICIYFKRLGSDRKEPPYAILELGSVILKLGFSFSVLVCPKGRFKDFTLLGSIVLAWGGLGLRFALAGPLKIQIWRPSKSDQKTCQKHVNL